MDLIKTLDSAHSRAVTDRVVHWVGKSPKRFAELVALAVTGNGAAASRACWALTNSAEVNPHLLEPHFKALVNALGKAGQSEERKRSIVRTLQFVDIPKSQQGKAATICFGFVNDPGEAIAVRCFSISVLERLANQNPGLRHELRLVLEDHLNYGSSGFRSRASRVLKRLRQG